MMQSSRNATIRQRPGVDEALLQLAEAFEAHWADVFRFLVNKKLRSAIYQGAAAELSHAELAAITTLGERDARMGDLAAQIGLSESSATRLVDRLAAADLVERRTSLTDRRCVTAGLTARGRSTLKELRAARRDFLKEILATLPAGERAELVRLFGRVAEELRMRETAPEVRA